MTAAIEKFGSIGGFDSLLDDSYIFKGLKKHDYPQFVTKTIRLIGQNAGLRVLFAKSAEGSCFNIKTKTVTIPAPPPFYEGSDKKERKQFEIELARWRGILNHEVGHAMFTLWHADPSAKKIERKAKLYPVDHHMFNDLFENGRMERVACQHYPGMVRDLQKLEDFLAEIIQKIHDNSPSNFNHIYYALRMVVNGYEPRIPMPEELREIWNEVKEMAKEAWETDDEEETYKIAQKVADFLKKKHEEATKDEKKAEDKEKELEKELQDLQDLMDALGEGSDAEGEDEGDGGSSEDAGGDDGPQSIDMPWDKKGKNSVKIEIAEEEGESEEGDDSEEDGEDEEGKDSKGKSKDNNSDKDSEDGEGKNSKGESKESRMEKLEKEIEEKKKEIADTVKEKIKAKMAREVLDPDGVKEVDPTKEYEIEHEKDIHSVGRGGEVVPLPLHDYVNNVEVEAPTHSERTKKLLDECMGAVCGMAQRFIQKVRSRVHVGVRTFKGRVNRRKLHRYKYDSNIFRTQNLRKKKDASVMIIVDCSGSMGGSKIDTARKAALVIGEMMYRAKVEFEIRGFTIPFYREYSLGCFTRCADLIHYRFGGSKDWNHTQHNVVDGKLRGYSLQDNDDGESLRHFADELSHSKKDTKMMVVISDGAPASGAQAGDGCKDLKRVIPEIRESGIDVYAIGLDTNVAQFYDENKSVRLSSRANTTELVEAIGQFVGLIANN